VGDSPDQIAGQIADKRTEMQEKIVALREQTEKAARRTMRVGAIALGAGAAVGVALVGGYLVYRMTRKPTLQERIYRVVPEPWWKRAIRIRDTVELGFRRSVPSMRLYVGDRQVGEEPPASQWQKIGLRFAQAAGSAVGAALVARITARLKGSQEQ
jgi:hypothetical protein